MTSSINPNITGLDVLQQVYEQSDKHYIGVKDIDMYPTIEDLEGILTDKHTPDKWWLRLYLYDLCRCQLVSHIIPVYSTTKEQAEYGITLLEVDQSHRIGALYFTGKNNSLESVNMSVDYIPELPLNVGHWGVTFDGHNMLKACTKEALNILAWLYHADEDTPTHARDFLTYEDIVGGDIRKGGHEKTYANTLQQLVDWKYVTRGWTDLVWDDPHFDSVPDDAPLEKGYWMILDKGLLALELAGRINKYQSKLEG